MINLFHQHRQGRPQQFYLQLLYGEGYGKKHIKVIKAARDPMIRLGISNPDPLIHSVNTNCFSRMPYNVNPN